MSEGPAFTAETNILQALLCRTCSGEERKPPCAACNGTGGEPAVVAAFQKLGLRCWLAKGTDQPCVASEVETLSDVALFHEMDLDKLLGELNALPLPKP
jgi:hypothetical protein